MNRTRIFAFVAASAVVASTARAQGPGPGGPMQEEQKIVAQFDKNGDNRLDNAERKAAREFLATQPQPQRGRGMGPGGPGAAGGPPNGPPNGPPGGFAGGPGGRGGRGGRGFTEPAQPGKQIAPVDVKSYATPFYDEGSLRTLFFTFENADWEKELAAFVNTDVEVPATMIVDGKTYQEVGVHFRGASSYFGVPEGYKRSLNVAVDFAHDSQAVGGYRTLNLLNAHDDPTFMRTVLYHRVARDYIAAPRANFVRVVINGENWGVYASAQQFNKDFLRDNYKTTDGARWKVPGSPQGRGSLAYLGDDASAYRRIYEIKTADKPKSWNDFIGMLKVLNNTPPEQLEAALAPIFDIEGALKFLALEIALVNADGYWVRSSDYSIYQDPKGVFHLIPHDANETFSSGGGPMGGGPMGGGRRGMDGGRGGGFPPGGGPPGGPPGGGPPMGPGGPGAGRGGVSLDPLVGAIDVNKPLMSKLLAVPALRAKYISYVRDIATKWLDWKTLEPIARGYQTVIGDEVRIDTRKLDTYDAFVAGIAGEGGRLSLKSFAEQRRAFLLSHPALAR